MDPEAIQELLQDLGPVRIRRMFGGQGVFRDDRMVALVASGELFLKTDPATQPAFEAAGSRPFVFASGGKSVATSYWLMPGEAWDDPAEAARWSRLAAEAADRVALAKPLKDGKTRSRRMKPA